MKKLLFIFLLCGNFLMAQQVKYSEVKIHIDRAGIIALAQAGLAAEEGYYGKDGTWTTILSQNELEKVRSLGFSFEVLHDDYTAYIENRNKSLVGQIRYINEHKNDLYNSDESSYAVPQHFELGSMGGFYNLQEVINELDSMHLLYPNLISVKTAAGSNNSIENRPIYMVKISDNPNINEPEVKIYYHALIHCREPEGMQQLIFFMWYLLENYSTSEEIQYLVNNLEIYFVPVTNPDGYEYNHSIAPMGGGMWRKNRRSNGGGFFGVDLNRNFGYKWGYDNVGSSPNPWEETFRGTGPFSEPETQVQRDFCTDKNFRIIMNNHTYSNFLMYPWCYKTELTPDSTLQLTYASYFTSKNGFLSGTPGQILYNTNGDALDWEYGEQTTKPKIICFSTEIGNQMDGFWPPPSRIIPLAQGMMYTNFMVAHFALRYAEAKDISPVIIPEKQGYFKFEFKRLGMEAPSSYNVSIQPLDTTQIISVGGSKFMPNPAQFQPYTDSIAYTLNPDITIGTKFRFIYKVTNGLYTFGDTITKYFGQPLVVFQDDCNTMDNWTSSVWDVTHTTYHSPDGSITDSPAGNYSNNANYVVNSKNIIDLRDSPVAVINFFARWNIEKGFDYVQFLLSGDLGMSWTPQAGKYTHPGTDNQASGQPVYDGKNFIWVNEQIVTENYVSEDIKMRYVLKSDQGVQADGFYFDDFTVTIVDMPGVGTNNKDQSEGWLSEPFPNPASDQVVIRFRIPDTGPGKWTLLDAVGKEVKSISLTEKSGSIQFPVNNMPSGIYFYRVTGSFGSTGVKKLVITQ